MSRFKYVVKQYNVVIEPSCESYHESMGHALAAVARQAKEEGLVEDPKFYGETLVICPHTGENILIVIEEIKED